MPLPSLNSIAGGSEDSIITAQGQDAANLTLVLGVMLIVGLILTVVGRKILQRAKQRNLRALKEGGIRPVKKGAGVRHRHTRVALDDDDSELGVDADGDDGGEGHTDERVDDAILGGAPPDEKVSEEGIFT